MGKILFEFSVILGILVLNACSHVGTSERNLASGGEERCLYGEFLNERGNCEQINELPAPRKPSVNN